MKINLNTLKFYLLIGNSQIVRKYHNRDVIGRAILLLKSSKCVQKKEKTLNTSYKSCTYV